MTYEIKTLVKYQIEKAETTLVEAKLMTENNLWSGATNRAYYACFYIVTAALLSLKLSSKTHKGTKALFSKHFVSTGLITIEQNKFYSELFSLRQQSDYDHFFKIEPNQVKRIITSAEDFISIVKELISK